MLVLVGLIHAAIVKSSVFELFSITNAFSINDINGCNKQVFRYEHKEKNYLIVIIIHPQQCIITKWIKDSPPVNATTIICIPVMTKTMCGLGYWLEIVDIFIQSYYTNLYQWMIRHYHLHSLWITQQHQFTLHLKSR